MIYNGTIIQGYTKIQVYTKIQGYYDAQRYKDTRKLKGTRKKGYTVVQWYKGFMGTVVSRAFQSLHGRSLKTTLTVPLMLVLLILFSSFFLLRILIKFNKMWN